MKVNEIITVKCNGHHEIESDLDVRVTAVLEDCEMFEGVVVADRLTDRVGEFFTDDIELHDGPTDEQRFIENEINLILSGEISPDDVPQYFENGIPHSIPKLTEIIKEKIK